MTPNDVGLNDVGLVTRLSRKEDVSLGQTSPSSGSAPESFHTGEPVPLAPSKQTGAPTAADACSGTMQSTPLYDQDPASRVQAARADGGRQEEATQPRLRRGGRGDLPPPPQPATLPFFAVGCRAAVPAYMPWCRWSACAIQCAGPTLGRTSSASSAIPPTRCASP